ncbi:MAG: NAD-dependent epimerase/dehydratase family protein [Thermoflexales bacterium]|nr:NAD-dependent epimerase/dehydratase family protein [Thermoflexales bacterium]MDW8352283.1 NAD-dependent epimerase/dehydratase family protein [Anaerolineae bacterium]
MQCCVLGATGFIGGQIARAAVARGWRVRAVRRRPAYPGAIADLGVEWAQADLRDARSLVAAMRDCEVLFHAAAAYPQDFRHIVRAVEEACDEMRRVLDAARAAGVRRLIYTSSLTTLAQRFTPGMRALDERDFYAPGTARSAYYEAKLAMERLALATRDLEVVALLPTAVFGPGDVKPTTGLVIREAARGRIPIYFDAVINCVDVRDVAMSHLVAAQRGRAGERYILGGHNLTMQELLETIDCCQGVRRRRLRVSRGMVRAIIRLADMLPFVSVPENVRTFEFWGPVSSRKAELELGHAARPFAETVRDALAWFGFDAASSHAGLG